MQRAFILMKRAQRVNAIFSQWDINCSGHLAIDEVETVVCHWEPFATQAGKKACMCVLAVCSVSFHY